ncbi:YhgE/Pip domain-containing protein [Clostridium cylindrosporum]|nr:YhgE/Pip domain-containing protein [Clostridium cylindrosporum]
MNFLQVAGKDIKSILQNRIIRVSVIAIIVVPLLYSLLYLDAFWDPYSRLNEMPVAVVNLDKGAKLDGDTVNYGKDMINDLKDNTDVGWRFTGEKDADQGVAGNKYYAKFVIPEDFSQKIISAKEGKPQVANLKLVCNEKKNYLASQISAKVEEELKRNIIESVTDNYVTGSFDKLYDVKDGLTSAADGSGKLYDGISKLNDKTPQLSDGVNKLQDGSNKLYDGQLKLNLAISQVSDGLGQMNNKIPMLNTGVDKLYDGSNELKNGLESAGSGSNKLSQGSKKLYDSFNASIYPVVNQLKEGADQLNSALSGSSKGKTEGLEGASSALKDGGEKISKSSNELLNGYGKVKSGVDDLISGVSTSSKVMNSVSEDLQRAIETGDKKDIESALQKLQAYNEANKDAKVKLEKLKQGTESLSSSFNEYNNGVQNYTDKVSQYADATTKLAGNLGAISSGVSKISTGLDALEAGLNEKNPGSFGSGLKAVSDNMTTLNSGISKLNNGAGQINGGLKELKGSSVQLTEGVGALYNGSKQMMTGSGVLLDGQTKLNSGVSELGSKIPELKDGVGKLYDGSKELSDKLKDGSNEIKSGLVNSSKTMGEFVSKPVEVVKAPTNKVANYGTGFAPYFMSLSLWVGAIMMFFVISSKTDDDLNTSKFNKVFGKFLSFGFVGIMQALLLGFALLKLGLKPTNLFAYFGVLIFFSLVFVSIVQCLISLFGDAGRLLSIVLLILQLTSCSGTYPIEVLPNIFKALHPYMPFTYSVEILREVISATTIDYSLIGKDALILGIIMLVFLTITIVFKNVGERLQEVIEGRKHSVGKVSEELNTK